MGCSSPSSLTASPSSNQICSLLQSSSSASRRWSALLSRLARAALPEAKLRWRSSARKNSESSSVMELICTSPLSPSLLLSLRTSIPAVRRMPWLASALIHAVGMGSPWGSMAKVTSSSRARDCSRFVREPLRPVPPRSRIRGSTWSRPERASRLDPRPWIGGTTGFVLLSWGVFHVLISPRLSWRVTPVERESPPASPLSSMTRAVTERFSDWEIPSRGGLSFRLTR